jgi:hypothetical protein
MKCLLLALTSRLSCSSALSTIHCRERGKFAWLVSSANWRRSWPPTLSATRASWDGTRAVRWRGSAQLLSSESTSPKIALMRRADRVREGLLLGVDQTYGGHDETDANDPGCVKTRGKTVLAQGRVETAALATLFDVRGAFDTNRSCARASRRIVFTRPRPNADMARASIVNIDETIAPEGRLSGKPPIKQDGGRRW